MPYLKEIVQIWTPEGSLDSSYISRCIERSAAWIGWMCYVFIQITVGNIVNSQDIVIRRYSVFLYSTDKFFQVIISELLIMHIE